MFTVTILEKGATEARRLTFDKEEVTIGRISGNDIILPKGNISKRHARLVVKDDKFIVIDLKSTNGTYVNKERIAAPRVLTSDDKVYVGDFIMQLSGAGLAAAIPRADSGTNRSVAPSMPPPPLPPGISGVRGRTDQAPPATVLEDSEAATRAISLDELEAEAGPAFAASSAMAESPLDESELLDGGLELEIEVDAEPVEGEIDVPYDEPPEELPADDFVEDEEVEERTMAFQPGMMGLPPQAPEPEAAPELYDAPEPEPYMEPEPPFVPEPQIAPPQVVEPPQEAAPPPRRDSVRREVPAPEPLPVAPPPPPEDDDSDEQLQLYGQILDELHQRAATSVFADLDPDQLELSDQQWTELETAVGRLVSAAREAGEIPLGLDDATLTHDVLYEFTGLGPVEYFLGDEEVERIYINDFSQILVVSGGTTRQVFKSFSSPAALDHVVEKLAGALGFAAATRPPVFSGELPDGTAFQVLLPPLSAGGPVLSFVKPVERGTTLEALLGGGAISESDAETLAAAVANRANIAVFGRAAADRQAVLSALALYAPDTDRVVVVEPHQSLRLPHRNATRLRLPALPEESAQLFRILPVVLGDRLVVSGASGADLAAVLELAHGGAEGVLLAAYGRDVRDGLVRLGRASVLAGRAPVEAADGLVRAAIDLAVHVDRAEGGAPRLTVEYTS